ncbi:MAG: transcriptional regulator [Coriobacteriales bacterium]|jgi:DNA-binding MarR family transcriptional regulator|nr:transcriptional regulator [Coriobacteriales bacterium]
MDYPSAAIEQFKKMFGHYRSGALSQIDRYSSGESHLLGLLNLHGEPLHPSDLQKQTCNTSARIAAILVSLEKKGFITREIDRQDRRKVLVSITDKGREHAQYEIDKISEEIKAVLRQLGKRDTEELLRILERLLEILTQQPAQQPAQQSIQQTTRQKSSRKQGAHT